MSISRIKKAICILVMAALCIGLAGCSSRVKDGPCHVSFDVDALSLSDAVYQKLLIDAVDTGVQTIQPPVQFQKMEEAQAYLGLELLSNPALTEDRQLDAPQMHVYSYQGKLLAAVISAAYKGENAQTRIEVTVTLILGEGDKGSDSPAYQSGYNGDADLVMNAYSMKDGNTAYIGTEKGSGEYAVAEFEAEDIVYSIRITENKSGNSLEHIKVLLDGYENVI